MKVIFGKSSLERETIPASCVTVGTFDGVHLGHAALISRLLQSARETGTLSTIVTFYPHPQLVLGSKGRMEILTTTDEKLELLEKFGIDLVIILEFNQQLATMEAAKFIELLLVDQLNMKHFVIGYDHSFGRNRAGNYELAKSLSGKYGYTVECVGPVNDYGSPIKSTSIRHELKSGDYDKAVAMLGYKYFLKGDIIKGRGLGKQLGFPTMNINVPPAKLLPKQGVYAAWLDLEAARFPGMAYIGGRLTFGDESICVEVNLFDFDSNYLGHKTRLTLEKYTRPPQKFDNTQRLIEALSNDEKSVRKILNL